MSLEKLMHTSITLSFEYYREEPNELVLLATGRQIAIWTSPGQKIAMLPWYLYDALRQFSEAELIP